MKFSYNQRDCQSQTHDLCKLQSQVGQLRFATHVVKNCSSRCDMCDVRDTLGDHSRHLLEQRRASRRHVYVPPFPTSHFSGAFWTPERSILLRACLVRCKFSSPSALKPGNQGRTLSWLDENTRKANFRPFSMTPADIRIYQHVK